jgi:hypothetical protein
VDSEETDGDSMIISSSTIMLTEVRLLIVCTIVDAIASKYVFGYEFFSFA